MHHRIQHTASTLGDTDNGSIESGLLDDCQGEGFTQRQMADVYAAIDREDRDGLAGDGCENFEGQPARDSHEVALTKMLLAATHTILAANSALMMLPANARSSREMKRPLAELHYAAGYLLARIELMHGRVYHPPVAADYGDLNLIIKGGHAANN